MEAAGGAGEESVFMLPLPGFGAGDERERRWRCGCRCSNLYLSVSPRCGGTAASLLWASVASSAVPVTSQKQQCSESGMVPIRMEQANICLSQKNPDESAY